MDAHALVPVLSPAGSAPLGVSSSAVGALGSGQALCPAVERVVASLDRGPVWCQVVEPVQASLGGFPIRSSL